MKQLRVSNDSFTQSTLSLDNPSHGSPEVDSHHKQSNHGESLWSDYASVHQALAYIQTVRCLNMSIERM